MILQQEREDLQSQLGAALRANADLCQQLQSTAVDRDAAHAERERTAAAQAAAEAIREEAVREYRCSEVVAVGLRDAVRQLQQQLADANAVAAHQARIRAVVCCLPACRQSHAMHQ